MILRLLRSAAVCITMPTSSSKYQFVISKLFQRKQQKIKEKEEEYQHNAYKNQKTKPNEQTKDQSEQSQKTEKSQAKEQEQGYDMLGRKLQIQSGKDYIKLKMQHLGEELPEGIGKLGGIDELVYWSQSVHTPEAIIQLVSTFNQLPSPLQTPADTLSYTAFLAKVKQTVYLSPSIAVLYQFCMFGFRAELVQTEYWSKIDEKIVRMGVKTEEEEGYLVDILFLISGTGCGDGIFNLGQQIAKTSNSLTPDQIVKLCLSFFHSRRGEPPLIGRLLKLLEQALPKCDAEHVAQVLPALHMCKTVSSSLTTAVQDRVIELQQQFNLKQLMNICEFLGSSLGQKNTWKILQNMVTEKLTLQISKGNKISNTNSMNSIDLTNKEPQPKNLLKDQTMFELVMKVMVCYKFSLDFVREFIIKQFDLETERKLGTYPLPVLSTLAKALYIYELEKETAELLISIQKTMISRITAQLNELSDQALVHVIRDYNITRHGTRDLFLFFEEVVRVKYVERYVEDMDRNSVELLVQIYEGSGMCSQKILGGLKALL